MNTKKKYVVDYCSGSTGYGWEKSFNKIEEVENCIKDFKNEYTAKVTVYDYELNDFVFYKKALTLEAFTNLIYNNKRDFRTKTRIVKTI